MSEISDSRKNISWREIAIAVFLAAFGGAVIALSGEIQSGVQTDPLGPRVFPSALGAGIALCGLLLGVGALFRRQPKQSGLLLNGGDAEEVEKGPFSSTRLLGAVVATVIYVAAFESVGYLIATPLYVVAILLIHAGASWRTLIVAPVLITSVLYVTFRFALRIPVPGGVLERLLC
jgi:putative tricarboxylic transport membrane protein